MVKKITPDPPPVQQAFSAADKGKFLRNVSQNEPEPAPRLLDTLTFTRSNPITSQDPDRPTLLAIQPGINAQDALIYVSRLLETAELNGDEISLHTNPVERALFWSMLHSVEVARAVVEALLEGGATRAGQASD
ncbi:hypothetical protein [Pseudomonas gingeri]|uniref:hypothetical protein n=1 Tax=Pseudomonas gingeri TaxID=117681 RepID=UPI0015A33345|nr:hypothetical protein [Pseudomonas gingeri]NVZ65212.1 hypothetical protein [Pseudomonas gingeri]NVZ75817.1 hypothetical protein [Pseudomonas gingeri]NWD09423.1 hypothetical protein [Pseudomonas gingeri]NWE35388.1 hypothetical protein [Pseudomonas gingeri]NWE59828.1 hypothetical protein [Pseudomonas gingeri]